MLFLLSAIALLSYVARSQSLQFKVTEVKAMRKPISWNSNGDGRYTRFIEFYNEGIAFNLQDITANGFLSMPSGGPDVSVPQGTYVVLYDAADAPYPSIPSCHLCSDDCDLRSCGSAGNVSSTDYCWCSNAIYVACKNTDATDCSQGLDDAGHNGCSLCTFNNAMNKSHWNIEFFDADGYSVDSVKCTGEPDWITTTDKFSYELIGKAMNNDIGYNWGELCSALGTPGADPGHGSMCNQVTFVPSPVTTFRPTPPPIYPPTPPGPTMLEVTYQPTSRPSPGPPSSFPTPYPTYSPISRIVCSDFDQESTCNGVCQWDSSNVICSCNSDIKLDILFALEMSFSGGKSGFKMHAQFAKQLATQSMNSADSKIGFITFSTHVNFSRNIQSWETQELDDYISGLHYNPMWTNTLDVIEQSIAEFDGTNPSGAAVPYVPDHARQQILILIIDGNPCLPESLGGCPQTICQYKEQIYTKGIRVVIVFAGSGGLIPQTVQCVTQSEDDFIPLNAFDSQNSDSIFGSCTTPRPTSAPTIKSQMPTSAPTIKSQMPTSAPTIKSQIPTSKPTTAPVDCGGSDILFAIDMSGSVGLDGFQMEKEFVKILATRLNDETDSKSKIGFATFSTDVNFSRSIQSWETRELENYVSGLHYMGGWTNTPEVIKQGIAEFDGSNPSGAAVPYVPDSARRKVLIVITAGNPCLPESSGGCPVTVCEHKEAILTKGIRVVIIAAGTDVNEQYVQCVIESDDDFIPLSAFSDLDFQEISCASIPSYAPTNRPTYAYESGCDTSDVLFAIDMSGSVGINNWEIQKEFVKIVTAQINDKTDTKIGFATFSTDVNFSRSIQSWETQELDNYVSGLYWQGGWTNTPEVIKQGIDEFGGYNPSGASVPYVPDSARQKVLMLVTSGDPCVLNDCPVSICEQREELMTKDIRVVVIAGGYDVSDELVGCVTQSEDDFIRVTSFNDQDFYELFCPNVDYPVSMPTPEPSMPWFETSDSSDEGVHLNKGEGKGKANGAVVVIVVILVLIVIGVGAYFWKKKKDEKGKVMVKQREEESDEEEEVMPGTTAADVQMMHRYS